MIILVLVSITGCLAILDITMKSVIEGYLKQGEERTAFCVKCTTEDFA